MRAAQVIPEPAATKVPAGEDVQVTFKAQFAPNLPRPGLVGVAVNGVYHTCTPGAPKPTATTKVCSLTSVYEVFDDTHPKKTKGSFVLTPHARLRRTCILP